MSDDSEKLSENELAMLQQTYECEMSQVTPLDTENLLARETELRQRANSCVGSWQMLGRQVLLLMDLIRDWYAGRYPLPWRVVAAVTAALLYFLNPFDVIPDLVPGVGYLDDVMVLGLCIKLVKNDLKSYALAKGLSLKDYDL